MSGPRGRGRLTAALYVVVVLLACVCVVGGVLVFQEHGERAEAAEVGDRYGAVLGSARTEVEAFVNIDYRDAQASIDRVAAGATGEFREQYTGSAEDVVKVLTENESVMTGEVVYAGVVDVDSDSATVIAATTGTVANTQTEGEAVARSFRLRLELQRVKGRWLTSDLQFVG